MLIKYPSRIIEYYVIAIIFIFSIIITYAKGDLSARIQYSEFFVNFVDIFSSIIIFINTKKFSKLFIILPISTILLFLMDILYLIAFYFNIKYSLIPYFVFTYSWYLFTILGLITLLISFVYSRKDLYLLFFLFISISFTIIFSFSPNFFVKYLNYPYYSIDLTAHITIFYLSILLMIACYDKSILITIAGLCTVEIGNFAISEFYLQNTLNILAAGEFCFFVGLLIFSIGMLSIIKYKLYNPAQWFFSSTRIRNKFSFLVFGISIWSFIIACVMVKEIIKIPNNYLVIFPAIGMLYSMITAIAAFIISKQMEKPFKLMQQNINSLFNEDKIINNVNHSLTEFKELHNFIIESYEYKRSLEKYIVSIATRIAHDIRSPIQIIENLIENSHNLEFIEFKSKLNKQIDKIGYISRSLLKENKHITHSSYGFQNIYSIIEDLISDKQIEWKTNAQNIIFEYFPNQIIWLNNKQAEIKAVISNLLNNAFEASKKNTPINLRLNLEGKYVVITIEDFGCGIKQDEINEILTGKTSKIDGNGIGLPTANKFMISIDGSLKINSKINQGTIVELRFPLATIPQEYAQQIIIKEPNVVIVDDNPEIISFWQEFFLFKAKNKQVKYFLNFYNLRSTLSQGIKQNTIYLLDYSIFGEQTTAIDIIKEFNLNNIYLVTDYAEDLKIQEEAKNIPIKLVSKSMINTLLQNNAIIN